MSEKCKTQDVAEVKNASARSCIISNKWKSPVRREYGERIKPQYVVVLEMKNTFQTQYVDFYLFRILMSR
jgi:hypothetical protein